MKITLKDYIMKNELEISNNHAYYGQKGYRMIHKSFLKRIIKMMDEIMEKRWCDYPISSSQEEHQKNMKIIDFAEKQAKEIVDLHFQKELRKTISLIK